MRRVSTALTLTVLAVALLGIPVLDSAPAVSPPEAPPAIAAVAQDAAPTTTGPAPPPSVEPPAAAPLAGPRAAAAPGEEHVIAGVPAYLWRDGCGPTSVGMVVGYYDAAGFDALVPGSAATQTAAVQQAIASHEETSGGARHYEDYALPRESGSSVLADRSEAPAGDEHAGDSVADFMHTSWSVEGSPYGSSWSDRVGPGFVDYVHGRDADVVATYRDYHYGGSGSLGLTFPVLAAEVDAGRPMVLFVDSSGDGVTDHAVAAVGYRESSGYPEYACRDTWYTSLRWQRFRGLSASYPWGVWGGTAFALAAAPSASPSPSPSPTPSPDTTPPVTTVIGLDGLWHAGPVTLTFSASDDASGVQRTDTRSGFADWVAGDVLVVQGQGTHLVLYRSVDLVGNVEPDRSCTVKIDGAGPRTTAWETSVRRGARASLRYRVNDLTPTASVRLVIRTRAGAVRKVFRLGPRVTGTPLVYRFRCYLARGVYRYTVYATDEAGNRQSLAGRARLTVK
ncbi:MAG: hypothetical protein WC709_10465 [Thermoleophilia bacterium]